MQMDIKASAKYKLVENSIDSSIKNNIRTIIGEKNVINVTKIIEYMYLFSE